MSKHPSPSFEQPKTKHTRTQHQPHTKHVVTTTPRASKCENPYIQLPSPATGTLTESTGILLLPLPPPTPTTRHPIHPPIHLGKQRNTTNPPPGIPTPLDPIPTIASPTARRRTRHLQPQTQYPTFRGRVDKTAGCGEDVASGDGGKSREGGARGFAEEGADDDGYAGAAGS